MTRAMGIVIGVLLALGAAGAGDVSVQVGSGLLNAYYKHKRAPVAAAVVLHGGEIGKTTLHPELITGYWHTWSQYQPRPVYNGGDMWLGSGEGYNFDKDGIYAGVRIVHEQNRRVHRDGLALWPGIGVGINQHWSRNAGSKIWESIIRYSVLFRLNVRATDTSSFLFEAEGQFNDPDGYQPDAMDGLFRIGYWFRAF